MKDVKLEICENRIIAPSVYEMVLCGDISENRRPGQFINIKLDGFYLRRPISVHDTDSAAAKLTIIYKTVGRGTEYMATLGKGAFLDVLTGLGNGFDVTRGGENPVVIGGGVGVPPMYLLAKELIARGGRVSAVLGFNRAKEIFCREKFEALGVDTCVTTADGSFGIQGFVTDAPVISGASFTYACGPEPMLAAVYNRTDCSGEYSFEERMGCGFGACMGCSCKTKYGNKRICKDGPVLTKEEIIW